MIFCMIRIEFDSNCFKHICFFPPFFRENAYLGIWCCQRSISARIVQISLSYHGSLELFSVFSVALVVLYHCTYLAIYCRASSSGKLGFEPPFLFFRCHSRGTLWYDLCYSSIKIDERDISYECISVFCSMPIAVVGNKCVNNVVISLTCQFVVRSKPFLRYFLVPGNAPLSPSP